MARHLTILGAFVLALPIAIEAPHDSGDASGHETRISIGGGVGHYALIARDCEGRAVGHTPVDYREVGAEVDRQLGGPWHVGIRGGLLHDEAGPPDPPAGPGTGTSNSGTNRYVNPYLSVEGRRAGFGGGWVGFDKPVVEGAARPFRFSGHLRLGGRGRYFSVGVMENVPLYSGGGYSELGIGFRPHRRVDSWIGLGSGPFDGAGAALKADWQMNPRLTLDMRARLGLSGDQPQVGAALGITSRFGRIPDEPASLDARRFRDARGHGQGHEPAPQEGKRLHHR